MTRDLLALIESKLHDAADAVVAQHIAALYGGELPIREGPSFHIGEAIAYVQALAAMQPDGAPPAEVH